jgi:glutathione S-transferase
MKLYGSSKTRALRCLWALEETGLDYQHISLDPKTGEHKSGEYRELIKTGKVPLLVDGDLQLFESSAICVYTAKKAKSEQLWPSSNLHSEALAQQWLSFALQELDPYLWISFLHSQILPEKHRVTDILPFCHSYLQRSLRVVDEHLQKQSYLLGDEFSLADILVGHCLMWAGAIDRGLLSETQRAYVRRLKDRPAFQRASKLE